MKPARLAALAVCLAACAPRPEIRYLPPPCPPAPECRRADVPLETNADLVRAYLAAESDFYQCKAARDALAACLKAETK